MARFIFHNDLELVLRNCGKLKGKQYGINVQYPVEIEQRRRKLYPILKKARDEGKRAHLVRDKLYINRQLYVPDETVLNNEEDKLPYAGALTGQRTTPGGSRTAKRQKRQLSSSSSQH